MSQSGRPNQRAQREPDATRYPTAMPQTRRVAARWYEPAGGLTYQDRSSQPHSRLMSNQTNGRSRKLTRQGRHSQPRTVAVAQCGRSSQRAERKNHAPRSARATSQTRNVATVVPNRRAAREIGPPRSPPASQTRNVAAWSLAPAGGTQSIATSQARCANATSTQFNASFGTGMELGGHWAGRPSRCLSNATLVIDIQLITQGRAWNCTGTALETMGSSICALKWTGANWNWKDNESSTIKSIIKIGQNHFKTKVGRNRSPTWKKITANGQTRNASQTSGQRCKPLPNPHHCHKHI